MITTSDAFNCPRCEGLEGLTIPMFLDGEPEHRAVWRIGVRIADQGRP